MEDYEAFARTVGALVYNTSHVDIIQLALSEPEESAVFKAAKNLTLQRLHHVYTFEVCSLYYLKAAPNLATALGQFSDILICRSLYPRNLGTWFEEFTYL